MKLSSSNIEYLQNLINAAKVIGVDEFKIVNGAASGLNDQQTAVLFHPINHEFPFSTLGLNRIALFNSRMAVLKNRENFSLNVVPSPNDPDTIQALKIKSKGANVDFRVANPTTIRAPKSISDEMIYAFELTEGDIQLIAHAASVMPSSGDDKEGEICFTSNDEGGVDFEIVDKSNDNFKGELDTSIISLKGEDKINFCKRYPLKTLLSAINRESSLIKVGQKGMMNITINGVSVYVLPRA